MSTWKSRLLRAVNVTLGTLFLLQLLTGLSNGLWSRPAFEMIHGTLALLLTLAALLHVLLNWGWVKANLFQRRRVS